MRSFRFQRAAGLLSVVYRKVRYAGFFGEGDELLNPVAIGVSLNHGNK